MMREVAAHRNQCEAGRRKGFVLWTSLPLFVMDNFIKRFIISSSKSILCLYYESVCCPAVVGSSDPPAWLCYCCALVCY